MFIYLIIWNANAVNAFALLFCVIPRDQLNDKTSRKNIYEKVKAMSMYFSLSFLFWYFVIH